MQLDADLGIDSIKRVEILSALQDRLPSLPTLRPEQLGSLRTLRAIGDLITASEPTAHRPTAVDRMNVRDESGEIRQVLVDIIAEKTGYPAEMLEPDMRLDADLGIDSIKRVEIFSAIQEQLPASRAAGPEQIGVLGTIGGNHCISGHRRKRGDAGRKPCRSRDSSRGRDGTARLPGLVRMRGGEDRLSDRHARARHAARYGPRYRLDQAG